MGSDCSDLRAADPLHRRRSTPEVGTIARSEQSALFRRRNNADYACGDRHAELVIGCRYARLRRVLRVFAAALGRQHPYVH